MSDKKEHKKLPSILKTVASKQLEEEVLQELEVPDPENPEKTISSLLEGKDEDTEKHDGGTGTQHN